MQIIVELRTGRLHAAACAIDATSQADANRRAVKIPARFWCGMLDDDIFRVMLDTPQSTLDAGQCIRLWECLKRRGTPPKQLVVAFSTADIRKLWPRG